MTKGSESEDRRFLLATAESLPDYLLSNVLFWPVSGFSQPLTPGNLLFAFKKVAFYTNQDVDHLDDPLLIRIQDYEDHYRSAWRTKVDHEIRSRLNQWKNTLSDIGQGDPNGLGISACGRLRTLLALLLKEDPQLPSTVFTECAALDQRFRLHTVEAEFIWDQELKPVFPREEFWFLYRKFTGEGGR